MEQKEKKKANKIEIFAFVFSTLLKVSRTYKFSIRIAKGCSLQAFGTTLFCISGSCSNTLCTCVLIHLFLISFTEFNCLNNMITAKLILGSLLTAKV